MKRRSYIASVGVVGLTAIAGCSGGGSDDSSGGDSDDNVVTVAEDTATPTATERPDSDNDGVPDIEDDYPNDPSRSRQLLVESDTRNIEEDSWYYYPLEFSQDGVLEYDFIVREGPAIDVIIIDESEYQPLSEGERYSYYDDWSVLDSTGDSVQVDVPAGNYRMLLDNSEIGEAVPPTDFENNVVQVEFDIETSV